MSVRGTTVICSNTHTNAANRAQTGEEPGTKRKAKKKKSKYQCGSNGISEREGRGGRGDNSTCLRAFCSVALALIELSVRPTFALKFKLIQFC